MGFELGGGVRIVIDKGCGLWSGFSVNHKVKADENRCASIVFVGAWQILALFLMDLLVAMPVFSLLIRRRPPTALLHPENGFQQFSIEQASVSHCRFSGAFSSVLSLPLVSDGGSAVVSFQLATTSERGKKFE